LSVVSALASVQEEKQREKMGAAERRRSDKKRENERVSAKNSFFELWRSVDADELKTFDSDVWSLVESAQRRAQDAGASVGARELWEYASTQLQKAVEAYDAAVKTREGASVAREAYMQRREALNQDDWIRYGKNDWWDLQKLERSAISDFKGERFDSARVLYEEALKKLLDLEPVVAAGRSNHQVGQELNTHKTQYQSLRIMADQALQGRNFKELDAIVKQMRGSIGIDDNGSYIRRLEDRLEIELQPYYEGKRAYEALVAGFDHALLKKFGGKDWEDAQNFVSKAEEFRYNGDMTESYFGFAADRLRDLSFLVIAYAIEDCEKSAMWAQMRGYIDKAYTVVDRDSCGQLIGLDEDVVNKRIAYLDLKKRKFPFKAQERDWMADLGNNVFMDFIRVESGSFEMGSGWSGEKNEKPRHKVNISKSYWLSKTEVTQEAYRQIMRENPSRFKGEDLPVESISWQDAIEFCRRLTKKERESGRISTDYIYVLPTEAQWEYACRAGSGGKYSGEIEELAWYSANSKAQTQGVASLGRNKWGFYDMHGNVWEWCLDFAGNYQEGTFKDPAFTEPNGRHIIRGGSWNAEEENCRSASRLSVSLDDKYAFIGFRPALVRVR
jgi:formylglycine-generating enzyme required for sulfatase activity